MPSLRQDLIHDRLSSPSAKIQLRFQKEESGPRVLQMPSLTHASSDPEKAVIIAGGGG
jgi:hypothetical protein